jgi:hypothetical protein
MPNILRRQAISSSATSCFREPPASHATDSRFHRLPSDISPPLRRLSASTCFRAAGHMPPARRIAASRRVDFAFRFQAIGQPATCFRHRASATAPYADSCHSLIFSLLMIDWLSFFHYFVISFFATLFSAAAAGYIFTVFAIASHSLSPLRHYA